LSYSTINQCANDSALYGRVSAAVAQEGVTPPMKIAGDMMWAVAAKSDIEAAYASALAAGNPNPGGDESVITDGMILSAVQASMPPAT
jgi:hypothetical protein